MSVIWKAVRRFLTGDVSGAAMVEFTLCAPILLGVAIYTMDFGLLFFTKIEVQNATEAGAQYAIVNDTWDSAKISSVAQKATRFTAVTATSYPFCGCPTPAAPATPTSVNRCSTPVPPLPGSCDTCDVTKCAPNVQGLYVTVTATPTAAYQTFIPWGVAAHNYNVSATSTVRIR
jgi:Flp pilus assembly protein TadG